MTAAAPAGSDPPAVSRLASAKSGKFLIRKSSLSVHTQVYAMLKALIFLALVLGLAWYQLAGPGAPGNTPRGTARAFLRAVASDECATRMDDRFARVEGARAACSPVLARALRASSQIIVNSNDGHTALVECFYGST